MLNAISASIPGFCQMPMADKMSTMLTPTTEIIAHAVGKYAFECLP